MPFQLIDRDQAESSIPLVLATKGTADQAISDLGGMAENWLTARDFKPAAGKHALIPGADGDISAVLVIVDDQPDIWSLAGLSKSLPDGAYHLETGLLTELSEHDLQALVTGWAIGTYRFDRYKSIDAPTARLVWPDGVYRQRVEQMARATSMVRDLINTPAEDMGPGALADAAKALAADHGAECRVTTGTDLLDDNLPMIHAVGRAADRAPRLIDLTWGNEDHPKVTLVGKGVCFDSGGLDIKPASGMELMKKDMGGAANVLGLAKLVMGGNLPVRLRVLVPAVENAVSGNAFRPGDILPSRKGLTVEIGNTDAEGRLILADALALAAEEEPDLLIDMATLTGAARVAVGTELAAFMTDDEDIAAALNDCGAAQADPVWRLPLWQPYLKMMKSDVADLNNAGSGRFAGATTAGLFLKEFVDGAGSWVHFDIMGYNSSSRPGRPKGGEAMGMRALDAYLRKRYGAR